MGRDRSARPGTSSGPGGKARSGQITGATQLTLLSATNAGHTGLNWITQAVSSTSTWYAFAGHVMFQPSCSCPCAINGEQAVRILWFDTSAHGSPWPLFLQDLEALAKTKTGQHAYRFVDEAPFLEKRSTGNRALTHILNWLTINVTQRRTRMLAYEAAARFLRYRRHPVRYADLNRRLLEEAKNFAPQVVLVVMGFHIAPETLHAVKKETGAVLIN